jgi:hypothetical protein
MNTRLSMKWIMAMRGLNVNRREAVLQAFFVCPDTRARPNANAHAERAA